MDENNVDQSISLMSLESSGYTSDGSLAMTPVKSESRSQNSSVNGRNSKAEDMNVSYLKSQMLSKRPAEDNSASKPDGNEGHLIPIRSDNKENDKALILIELRTQMENPFEVDYYCTDHQLHLSAKDCVMNHRSCNGVIPVLEWAKRNRETRELTKLERAMTQYAYFGSLMSADRIEQRDALDMRKTLLLEQFNQYQEDTITHLLTLQAIFVKKFDDIHETNIQGLISLSKRTSSFCKEALDVINKIKSLLKQVKDRNYEFTKTKREVQLKSLVYEEILRKYFLTVKRLDYVVTYDPAYEAITKNVKKLAYIKEVPQPSKLPSFLSQSKEVRYAKRQVKDLDRVFCKHPDDESNCCISGCCYLADGKIVLADWNNRCVKLLDKFFNVVSRLVLPQSPWNVAKIDDEKVAVTVPGEKSVYVLTYIKNLKTFGSFETRCECWGITFVEHKFVITCDPLSEIPSLKFFSLDGNEIKSIKNEKKGTPLFKCPSHVITNTIHTLIFVSDCGTNLVTCLNLEGKVKFQFRHEKLDYPTGMTTDCQANVYICGKNSHNIHVITEEGVFLRILLSENDGLHGPRSISFETNGENFIASDLSSDHCDKIIHAKLL
ncbi:hypothetical protein ACJMK2_006596 [Sinanodonta woodiana]|uniref:Uncharacterized protein n=1 Tax=Sinanodonta woodiana TaxID=1069815 RepID=A0ABD3VX40_SINWO